MKNILFAYLFMFSSIKAQNCVNYFFEINKAEALLTDSLWEEAAGHYDLAFKQPCTPFANDYHNAIVCNVLTKNFKKASKLSEQLILKGCDLSYFDKPYFKDLLNSSNWKKIKRKYLSLKKKSDDLIDNQTKKLLLERFEKDLRVNDPKRKSYFYDNILWLKERMMCCELPYEKSIGITFDKNEINTTLSTNTMLVHWFSMSTKDTLKLIDLLHKSVLKGELHPAVFASLPNKPNEFTYGKRNNLAFMIVGDSVFSPVFKQDELVQINTNRYKLGLPSFEDYQKIVLFASFDKRFRFPHGHQKGFFDKDSYQVVARFGYTNYVGSLKKILNMDELK